MDKPNIMGGIYAKEADEGLRCHLCFYEKPTHSPHCPHYKINESRNAIRLLAQALLDFLHDGDIYP